MGLDLLLAPLCVSALVAGVAAGVELSTVRPGRVRVGRKEHVSVLVAQTLVQDEDGVVILKPSRVGPPILAKVGVADDTGHKGRAKTLAVEEARSCLG